MVCVLSEEATYTNFIVRSGLSRLPLGPTIYRTRRGHHYTIDAAFEFVTVFSEVCVAQSSIFCVVFCRSFVCPFVLLSFFIWSLCYQVLLLLVIVLSGPSSFGHCVVWSFFFWSLCCLTFFIWSLCCLVLLLLVIVLSGPSSFGHCVVWPSSFGHCVVCPSI
jgi:hypothetical protein